MTTAAPRLAATRTAVIVAALALWFLPPPDGLTLAAWRLFIVFGAAIVSVVVSCCSRPTISR